MVAPLSTHLPEVALDVVEVTGELTVKTGLRKIKTAVVSLNATNVTADEESLVTWYKTSVPGDLVLRVEKGGANSGVLGDSAVNVSYLAVGE